MSLLKAYGTTLNDPRSYEELEGDFLDIVEECHEDPDQGSVEAALAVYAAYSVRYLVDVAQTLTEPHEAQQTMKFMNSYIVEMVVGAGLHYYDKERSKSIVDLVVQEGIAGGGVVSRKKIRDMITEVEDSFLEDELEFGEEADESTH